jgi:hypothetical protein
MGVITRGANITDREQSRQSVENRETASESGQRALRNAAGTRHGVRGDVAQRDIALAI